MKNPEKWQEWWAHRVTYRAPKTESQVRAHERVNAIVKGAGDALIEACPGGEELEFALQAMREVRMWANASLAIHGTDMEEKVPAISTVHEPDEAFAWEANNEGD